jgi:hypothetical protein
MHPTDDRGTSSKLQSPARRSLDIALSATCAGLPVASARSVYDRIFIVEQVGRILARQRGADTTDVTTPLDRTGVVSTAGSEQGLLGLAFDPDPGEHFAYLVTAVLPDARETSPGDPSVGVRPRQLSEDPCP